MSIYLGSNKVDIFNANIIDVGNQILTEDLLVEGTVTSFSLYNNLSIRSYAFFSCSSLTEANFPACTSIGSYAFASCTSLTSVIFPACTNITYRAFYNCTSLTTASFPACETIGQYAFQECHNLISLNLTGVSSVPTLGSSAFNTTPIGGNSAYAGQYGSVYVPASLYNSFLTAENWSSIADKIVSV